MGTQKNPFITQVRTSEEHWESYSDQTSMYWDMVAGKITGDQLAREVVTTDEGQKPGKWRPLKALARKSFKVRCLYAPVKAHAWRGFYLGWVAGVALKALDTGFLFYSMNSPVVILWFLIVAGFLLGLIPKLSKVSIVPAALMFYGIRYGGLDLLISLFAVSLVALMIPAPLGMAIGSIVGYIRRPHLPHAPGMEQGKHPSVILWVALPIAACAAFLYLYLYWLSPLVLHWLTAQ